MVNSEVERCVWIQGGWESDESMETIEEAGVVGNVQVTICQTKAKAKTPCMRDICSLCL